MDVAVLTLTRDRVAYTRHCFATLQENATVPFDHYILDQNSEDDTLDWLETYPAADVIPLDRNVGICRGLNILLDAAGRNYDIYVKFDNDCELVTPGSFDAACELAHRNPGWILSPHIYGLLNPPPVQSEVNVDEKRIGVVPQIGGIFMAIPGEVFRDGYRHNESNPVWGMDDVDLCHWYNGGGGRCGYLLDYPANHYKTTVGQQADIPGYFARKMAEMAA